MSSSSSSFQIASMNPAGVEEATGFYTEPIDNENMPAYFHNYTTRFIGDFGRIDTSFIGLIPSSVRGARILNVECSGVLDSIPYSQNDGQIREWMIEFNVLDVNVFPQFELQYGLEGVLTLTDGSSSRVVNASEIMTYTYSRERGILLFHIDTSTLQPPLVDSVNTLQSIPFSFNVMIQDDLDPPKYVRPAYANQRFPYQYTGQGQTILVPSYLESGYLFTDIIQYLQAQGITKSADDLDRQIDFVNVTEFSTFFWNGRNYLIPPSDGFSCNPPLAELGLGDADALTCSLEFILSIAPDANILIAYYGCNCDPNTGELTSRVKAEMELITWIRQNRNRFDLICDVHDHLTASSYDADQLAYFQDTFDELYQDGRTLLTSSGDLGTEEPDLYNVGQSVLAVGGSMYVPLGPGSFKQVCYPSSSGGFYPTIDNIVFPSYQVGVVEYPSATPANLETSTIIGVPTCCGLAKGLVYIFDGVETPIEDTSLGVRAITALFALINQGTQFRWRYMDIFYLEYDYVTDYIDEGSNLTYNARDYTNWNPITGLGAVDGEALLNMLSPRNVRSGDRIGLYCSYLQSRMAMLCMFPPTEFYTQEIRQPVFGPQCYWSYLVVYRVLEDYQLDLSGDVINNEDPVVIFSSLPFDLYWVMAWDPSGYVKMQRYQNVVEPNMVWIYRSTIPEAVVYSSMGFTLPTNPNAWLSCRSGLPAPSSSPSIRFEGFDDTCVFEFRRHSWFIEDSTLYPKLLAQNNSYSYYVNLANANYFMTSGYTPVNYQQGRQLVAFMDVTVKYGNFSGYPEMLLIPVTQVEEIVPESGQLFLFFNIRVQAFVRMAYDPTTRQSRVFFFNPNNETSGVYTFHFNECLFNIVKLINQRVPKLFTTSTSFGPTFANSTPARYNNFFTKCIVLNPKGYFQTPVTTIGNNDNSRGDVNTVIGASVSEELLLFHVQSSKMMATNGPAPMPMWIRQVLYSNRGYPNGAIYPNAPGTVDLPYMGPYDALDVLRGSTAGSWTMRNRSGFTSSVFAPDLQQRYFVTIRDASMFSFDREGDYIVDFPNSPSWQPQMLTYDGEDDVGHWRLIPQVGPPSNYIYTGCMYDYQNVRTDRFLSTIMNLSYTPSMLTSPIVPFYPETYLCLYTRQNDS